MIKYIELENFKSFKKITFNLTETKKKVKNMTFIYGENGVGKTNLIASFVLLRKLMDTINVQRTQKDLIDFLSEQNNESTSKNNTSFFNTIINKLKAPSSLNNFYKDNYRIGSSTPMRIKIGLKLDKLEADYEIKLFEEKIIEESLYGTIKSRKGEMFSISNSNIKLSNSIFTKEYQEELKKLINKYWGKHSLFSILNDEEEILNNTFLSTQVSDNLKIIREYIYNISVLSLNNKYGAYEALDNNIPIPNGLNNGEISIPYKNIIYDWEEAINTIFTSLYSDIQQVYYDTNEIEDKLMYRLMVKKNTDGEILDIPFSQESRGTKKILAILPMLLAAVKGQTVIIDEIDTGIHDLLMEHIIKSLREKIKGQFIVTTHNTYLLNHLPPSSVYIISSDNAGKKSIHSITDFDKKPQKNNSLSKMYLRGDFDGIPYSDYIDFEDITDVLVSKLKEHNKES